ncbi:hypothetical protein JCM11641_007026 [Rhodosporidiobolus odoratus]
MAGVAGGKLAAEVFKAGGVGFIGATHRPLENLKEEVETARSILRLAATDELPLGAGFIAWRFEPPFASSASQGLSDATTWLRYILFEARFRHIWLSFSHRGADGLEDWVKTIRELEREGAKGEAEKERTERARVYVMIQDEEAGQRARRWDVDAVVAQGTESGGHGPTHQAGQPVLSLIKSLAPAFPPDAAPFLLAAGGIAASASLPPAFSAGASAVVCGTVLSATSESLLPSKQKELLTAASLDSSIRSGSWDIARDGKNHWPEGVDGRALRNSVFEEEGKVGAKEAAERYKLAVKEGDVERVVTWAGSGVGEIKAHNTLRTAYGWPSHSLTFAYPVHPSPSLLSIMFARLRLVALAVLALSALSTAVDAKKTGKVLTTNQKQAAQLQAAAVFLKPGNYKLQNVQTKQTLYYVPSGNHIYPQKGKYTKAAVTAYSNKKVPWHRLGFGSKQKCLSSAWGSTGNNAAVMYVCASGADSKKTTLEKTKQWWLFVPVSKPTASASSTSYANNILLAAQADSISTREKKVAAQKAAFNKRDGLHGLEAFQHQRMMRTVRKRALQRRANKHASSGTYYIIAIDHLLDRAAALTGKQIKTRGIRNTVISNWKKGNKAQQWKVTRA